MRKENLVHALEMQVIVPNEAFKFDKNMKLLVNFLYQKMRMDIGHQ